MFSLAPLRGSYGDFILFNFIYFLTNNSNIHWFWWYKIQTRLLYYFHNMINEIGRSKNMKSVSLRGLGQRRTVEPEGPRNSETASSRLTSTIAILSTATSFSPPRIPACVCPLPTVQSKLRLLILQVCLETMQLRYTFIINFTTSSHYFEKTTKVMNWGLVACSKPVTSSTVQRSKKMSTAIWMLER